MGVSPKNAVYVTCAITLKNVNTKLSISYHPTGKSPISFNGDCFFLQMMVQHCQPKTMKNLDLL